MSKRVTNKTFCITETNSSPPAVNYDDKCSKKNESTITKQEYTVEIDGITKFKSRSTDIRTRVHHIQASSSYDLHHREPISNSEIALPQSDSICHDTILAKAGFDRDSDDYVFNNEDDITVEDSDKSAPLDLVNKNDQNNNLLDGLHDEAGILAPITLNPYPNAYTNMEYFFHNSLEANIIATNGKQPKMNAIDDSLSIDCPGNHPISHKKFNLSAESQLSAQHDKDLFLYFYTNAKNFTRIFQKRKIELQKVLLKNELINALTLVTTPYYADNISILHSLYGCGVPVSQDNLECYIQLRYVVLAKYSQFLIQVDENKYLFLKPIQIGNSYPKHGFRYALSNSNEAIQSK
jgi:hypothetical protein